MEISGYVLPNVIYLRSSLYNFVFGGLIVLVTDKFMPPQIVIKLSGIRAATKQPNSTITMRYYEY